MDPREDHAAVEEEEEEEEGCYCCMCGDVGFSDDLLPCPVCRTRLQHTYCSRMYPKIDVGRWRCEWCLHKDHEQQQQRQHSIATTRLKKRHGDRGRGKHGLRSSSYLQDSSISRNLELKEEHHPEMDSQPSRYTVTANKKHQQQQQQKESSSSMPTPPSCNPNQWRKPNCNPLSPRVVGRRYKLLADVLF